MGPYKKERTALCVHHVLFWGSKAIRVGISDRLKGQEWE